MSLYHSRGITGNGNFTNYTNPALDKLIDRQSEQFVESERKETIWEAQRMMMREHGPLVTLPSGFQYTARWSYVHFPFEIGQPPPENVLPFGADIWTQQT
jgi:ABC-type transport system substrate-binding protein